MKKGNVLKIGLLSIICMCLLTSCSLLEIIAGILENAIISSNNGSNNGNVEGYLATNDPNINVSLKIEEGKAGTNTTLAQFKKKEGFEIFPSIGTKNLLVIPVYFSDFAPSKVFTETEEAAKANIYNAFFGDDSSSKSETRTGWESVKSYYYKSSYGKLNLEGMVTDWCPLEVTLKETAKSTKYSDPSVGPLRKAVDWFKTNYPDEVSKFDLDNDGYLDGVVLVYANQYTTTNMSNYNSYVSSSSEKEMIDELCWAYTTWDNQNKSNISNPNANVYMWASYSFLWDGGYATDSFFKRNKLVDSHTFIHEFGHMMGLDDYYSYDDDGTSPLGKLDMMDYNIGDHNAYSKYLLGWIEPTLITDKGEFTINPSTTSTDALLIPASLTNYCYSAFDEYLLIEFYAPTNLNYLDAKEKYCGVTSAYPKMFTGYGVKIYHVDSRMIIYDKTTKTYAFTKAPITNSIGQWLTIAASNTPSWSFDTSYKLINLVSRRGVSDYYVSEGNANNSDLYVAGTSLNGYKFDNGETLNYQIVINSISEKEATIIIK